MFCTKCGNKIKETAKFCGSCGASASHVEVSQSSPVKSIETNQSSRQFNFKKTWGISTAILVLPIMLVGDSFETSGGELILEFLIVLVIAAVLSVLIAFMLKWRHDGFKIEKDVSLEGLGRDKARSDVAQGLVWMIGGAVFTAVSYAITSGGGTYFIAWGAVIFGGIQFIRGLATYYSNGGIPRNLIIGCVIGLVIVGSIGYLYSEEQKNKLSVLDLKQGDCFTSSESLGTETAELATVDIVSCGTGLWDFRVEKIFNLTVAGSLYSGQSIIDSQAESGCPVTTDTFFFPTTESWNEGDRSILCLSAR